MRIAVFSDVHGNLTALETVLADIRKQAPDVVAFAGDLCAMGARPEGCLQRVQSEVSILVHGNTDLDLVNPPAMPDDLTDEQRPQWETYTAVLQWSRSRLGQKQLDWLARLPFAHRISPTADAADDLLIVHANPVDVMQVIFPTADVQESLLGRVTKAQSDEELRPLLETTTAGIIAFGHLHLPNVRQWGRTQLANISSVSLPVNEKDNRAKYGLLTWQRDGGWSVEQRAVAYNVDKERELLSFLQPPNWEYMAKGLR
jgi:protein phosphatase